MFRISSHELTSQALAIMSESSRRVLPDFTKSTPMLDNLSQMSFSLTHAKYSAHVSCPSDQDQ